MLIAGFKAGAVKKKKIQLPPPVLTVIEPECNPPATNVKKISLVLPDKLNSKTAHGFINHKRSGTNEKWLLVSKHGKEG